MQNLLVIFSLLCITHTIYSQKVGAMLDGVLKLESGKVGPEKEIKFSFQKHNEETTEYSIAFFDSFSSVSSEAPVIELWGHGRSVLALFSDPKRNYNIEQTKVIINKIESNLNHFITKVRSKGRLFIHADINLDDDWIFSAYMDFKNPKYAFWYKGNKYPIEERKLIQMIEKFKLYFDI